MLEKTDSSGENATADTKTSLNKEKENGVPK